MAVFTARHPAPSRGIAPRALACAFALLAMVAQIASYAHPELIAHVQGDEAPRAIETVATTASSTLEAVPKTQRSCDADDDADDDSDDDCAPAHAFVRHIDLAAALPFAGRVITELAPARSLKLLLVAPKNSPPVA